VECRDKEANTFLKSNSDKVFNKIFEEIGKLYIGLYTCASGCGCRRQWRGGTNVQTVATDAEEMTERIGEILSNSTQVPKVSNEPKERRLIMLPYTTFDYNSSTGNRKFA